MENNIAVKMPVSTEEVKLEAGTSLWRQAGRRFIRNRTAIIGLIILITFVFAAVLAPWLSPYDPVGRDYRMRLKPPSRQHWLGTDYLGRDILTRIIYGARISLQVGLISVGIALLIGTFIGSLAGFYGGLTDLIVMRFIDVMMAFPSILLAIAIMAILGPELTNAMIAIGIVAIPTYTRIVRSSVLAIKESEYIEAARALGLRNQHIIVRHVLPNCLAPLIVQATLGVATAILDAAGLSFLGLGAQPPTPEWGAMLAECRQYLRQAPWTVAFPGLAIVVTVMGLNLLGDGLRDALDPRLKQ